MLTQGKRWISVFRIIRAYSASDIWLGMHASCLTSLSEFLALKTSSDAMDILSEREGRYSYIAAVGQPC